MSSDPRSRIVADIETHSLAITVRAIPRVLAPLLATDLTLPQLRALSVVVTADAGATGAGLAHDLGISMPSATRLVDRLVAGGLAARTADETDQRVRRIRPTDLGRAVVRELMAARPELGADVLAGLTLAELQALEVGLRAVSREVRNERDRLGGPDDDRGPDRTRA